MRLTDLRVQSLKAPERGQKTYRCDSLLGCRVSQGGSKTFILVAGRDRQFITIGRYPIISLAEARIEAKRILAERTLLRHQPQRVNFGETLDVYIEQHVGTLAPRTQQEIKRIFKRYLTKLLPLVRAKAPTPTLAIGRVGTPVKVEAPRAGFCLTTNCERCGKRQMQLKARSVS